MSILLLECSICLENYDDAVRIPRMFRCGHTKCHVCIKSIFELSSKPECPECQNPISIKSVEEIPINLSVIQINTEIERQSIPKIDIAEPCKKHKSGILDMYCKTCQQWVCKMCVLSKHKDPAKKECLIIPKEFAIVEMKEKLSDMKNNACYRLSLLNKQCNDKNEGSVKSLGKLNTKKGRLSKELELTNRTIEGVEEGKSKLPSVKKDLKNTEILMSKMYLELETVKSISEYSRIEKKMRDSYTMAKQIIDDAGLDLCVLDSYLTKSEEQTKTDSSNGNVNSNEENIRARSPTDMTDSSNGNVNSNEENIRARSPTDMVPLPLRFPVRRNNRKPYLPEPTFIFNNEYIKKIVKN